MSTGTIPSCPLSLTVETLSAWRDETLSPAELARVAAHLASCPACRGRLAQYDAIAAELRAQPIPAPEARLWDAVRASASSGARARRPTQALVPRAPRIWKGLAAVAAVLLLLAGFGQVLRMITAGRGPVSMVGTPTVGPIASLHWQPATFPAGFELAQPVSPITSPGSVTRTISVSPADGDTAYACAPPQPGQGPHPLVWVTHDRAAHWTRLTDVPSEGPVDICGIGADAHDPSVAFVELVHLQTARQELWATYDGGHTWQPLPGASQTHVLYQLTTIGATSYAVRTGNTGDQTHLMASTDHLQTWTAIDADIAAAHDTPFGLWVNPASGELLAAASQPAQTPGGLRLTALWDSRDAGQHWTRLPFPSMAALVVVGQPAAGKPWVLCAQEQSTTLSQPSAPRVVCSTDGGQTWLAEPPLVSASSNASDIHLFGIDSDGALLAMAPTRWDVAQQRVGYELYRLPPGARQWQDVGPVPESQVSFAPVAHGYVLWAFTSKQMIASAAPGSYAMFVAAYP